MKKYLTLPLILAIAISSSAQKINVTEVSEKVSWRVGVGNFIQLSDSGFLSLAYEGSPKIGFGNNYSGPIVLRRYGADLQEKQTATFKLEDIRADVGFLAIYRIGKTNCVLYAQKNKDADNIDVKCIFLDSVTLMPVNEIKLTSVSNEGTISVRTFLSPDGKLLVIKTRRFKSKTEYIEYNQFDESLKAIRVIKRTVPENEFITEQAITNNGEILLIDEIDKGKETQQCFLYRYENNGSLMPQKTVLDFEDKTPYNTTLYRNEVNQKYYLMGMYVDDYKRLKLMGVFCVEMPEKKAQKVKIEMQEFGNDLLSLVDNDGYANDGGKKKGLDAQFGCRNAFTRSDGSMDLAIEYNYQDTKTYMSLHQQLSISTTFLSGTIIDIHFVNGKAKFIRIPKSQKHSVTNAYNSAYSFKVGDKLVFLYNDIKGNITDPIDKSPSTMVNPKSAILVAAIIDENDKVERREVWDNGDGNYAFEPLSSLRLQQKKILLVQSKIGLANFKYRMAILNFE